MSPAANRVASHGYVRARAANAFVYRSDCHSMEKLPASESDLPVPLYGGNSGSRSVGFPFAFHTL